MKSQIKILKTGNKNKKIEKKVNDLTFQRWPIQTHLIGIRENIDSIWLEIKNNFFQEGDFLAVSEKFLAVAEGRVIHKSVIKPSWLAKFLVLGVKKYENDTGYSSPLKMQVAIMQAGYIRIFVAAIIGTITRLFGRHGDFYRIAGNRISEIDGFDPDTVKPFDEFATLGPANPTKTAQEIADKFKMPIAVVDSNNINTEILGKSLQIEYSDEIIREILLDNPMGQGSELTPIILVRVEK